VKLVEGVTREARPDVVYVQHGGDLNVDHELTFRAVLTALRPVAGVTVKRLCTFEVMSSTEWAFQSYAPVFNPNLYVNIAETLSLKLRALEVNGGEIRSFPHPRSGEAVTAVARSRGAAVGFEAAEAFQVVCDRW